MHSSFVDLQIHSATDGVVDATGVLVVGCAEVAVEVVVVVLVVVVVSEGGVVCSELFVVLGSVRVVCSGLFLVLGSGGVVCSELFVVLGSFGVVSSEHCRSSVNSHNTSLLFFPSQ